MVLSGRLANCGALQNDYLCRRGPYMPSQTEPLYEIDGTAMLLGPKVLWNGIRLHYSLAFHKLHVHIYIYIYTRCTIIPLPSSRNFITRHHGKRGLAWGST